MMTLDCVDVLRMKVRHMERLREIGWELDRVSLPWRDADDKVAPVSCELLEDLACELHRGWFEEE